MDILIQQFLDSRHSLLVRDVVSCGHGFRLADIRLRPLLQVLEDCPPLDLLLHEGNGVLWVLVLLEYAEILWDLYNHTFRS